MVLLRQCWFKHSIYALKKGLVEEGDGAREGRRKRKAGERGRGTADGTRYRFLESIIGFRGARNRRGRDSNPRYGFTPV
jgi:hypothetical protein